MRERRRALFPVVLVALLAVLGWWLLDEPVERGQEEPVPEPRAEYYLEDFTLQASDEAGNGLYRVSGPAAAYYREDDVWTLQQPRWSFRTREGDVWRGRAEQGRIWGRGERSRLQGDVRLIRPARGDEGRVRVQTDAVDLLPPDNYAETERPVVVTGPGYRIDAVGARVWLREERMELLSEVKGHYEPQARPN